MLQTGCPDLLTAAPKRLVVRAACWLAVMGSDNENAAQETWV